MDIKILIILVIFLISFYVEKSEAAPPSAQEYQIKAVFLYNFANFISWPSFAFYNENAPFTICILGENPFQLALEKAVKNEKIAGHPVVLSYFEKIYEVSSCHILFINNPKNNQLNESLNYLSQFPILTVSDTEGFVAQGGMIQFFQENNKVRFFINLDPLKAVGLQASANLLRVAKLFSAQ